MSSYFDDLVRTHLDPHVDRHYGEQVVLIPMARGPNGRPHPDPDRPIVTVTGILTQRGERTAVPMGARATGGRQSNDLRSIASGFESTLSIATTAFSSPEDHPRQGDLTEAGGYRHEIVSSQPDGTGRIVLHLVRLGPI